MKSLHRSYEKTQKELSAYNRFAVLKAILKHLDRPSGHRRLKPCATYTLKPLAQVRSTHAIAICTLGQGFLVIDKEYSAKPHRIFKRITRLKRDPVDVLLPITLLICISRRDRNMRIKHTNLANKTIKNEFQDYT
ncbi:MAG: hypothetical protein KJ017_05015 [Alphaproteobacteria bacterium]|nr:hypothetical protein [Alphaproteobacteria bacterium]